MNIQFAKSKAGHDKDQLYFILKEEEEFVYLVNGVCKTVHEIIQCRFQAGNIRRNRRKSGIGIKGFI